MFIVFLWANEGAMFALNHLNLFDIWEMYCANTWWKHLTDQKTVETLWPQSITCVSGPELQ